MSAGRRRFWLIPVISILLLVLGFSVYQWVIPRTDLEVRTVYHESPAGGGTGGSINLNVLFTNWGNREISDLEGFVMVRDHEGSEVARNSIEDMKLSRGDNAEIKIAFIGSQYRNYTISMEIGFECSGNTRSTTISHETFEDQMNIVFVDHIG